MRRELTKFNKNVVLARTLAGVEKCIGVDPTVICMSYVFLSLVIFESSIILYILLAPITLSAHSVRTNYGHNNAYYEENNYREQTHEQTEKRKEAEKIDDNEWNDF